MRRWAVLGVLGVAQFLMVIDTSVMNVSITALVEEFDTEVTAIQAVITLYSLVMAAFMITGGKLGDLLGRRRALRVGLVVYGTGSMLTALAPTLGVLAFGWSILEGLGATLVMPALTALIAASYTDRDRALAYGVIGGVSGAAVAVGPIIGGYVTTNFSYRWVFAGEVVLVIAILFGTRVVTTSAPPPSRPRVDVVSVVLSAVGLGAVVFATLQSSTWGWWKPRSSPVEPLGFSLTPFLLAAGAILLALFWGRQRALEGHGRTPLVRPRLLRLPQLRAGLASLMSQQTILMGVFFVVPLYLQVVLGLDAFETGVRLLPVSVTLLLFALAGARLAALASPRTIVRGALVVLLLGCLLLTGTVEADPRSFAFSVGLAVLGIGMGLLASQLGNVIQSAVDEQDRGETGGLQYTAQNLGSALGTAFIGAIVIGALAAAATANVAEDDRISEQVRAEVGVQLEAGVSFVPTSQVEAGAEAAGLSAEEIDAVVDSYGDAQLVALRSGLLVAGFLALAALAFTRNLPSGRAQAVAAS